MHIEIPGWLIIATLIPVAFLLGYRCALAFALRTAERRLGCKHGELPGVEPGWYPTAPTCDEDAPFKLIRLLRKTDEQEAPTTKRAIPGEQPAGEAES